MTIEEKDKTSELAEQKLASMEAEEKVNEATEKKSDESKGASDEDSSLKDEKTEGKEENKEDEKTSLNDVQILESKDEDLTDEQKTRKEELVQQAEDAKTPEEKAKDQQDNVQKRIDDLVGEIKFLKNEKSEESAKIDALNEVINSLKGELEQKGSLDSTAVKDQMTAEESYAKMVEEDKDLPRKDRREMSKAELDEYLLEEFTEASEWLADRSVRRAMDLVKITESKQVNETGQNNAKKFFTKFPDCDQKDRMDALQKEGKSLDEAMKIVREEKPDFSTFMDILKEMPELADINNPEAPLLTIKEMEKRKSNSGKTFTAEEVEKMKEEAIMEERKRVDSIDEGLASSESEKVSTSSSDPLYKQKLALFLKAGRRKNYPPDGKPWTEKDFQKTVAHGNRERSRVASSKG